MSGAHRVLSATKCRTRFPFIPDMEQGNAQGVERSLASTFAFQSRPRCSLTLGQERLTFWTLVALCFGVASGFAIQGYWLVLPFAGLEMGVLAWALASLRSRERDFEALTIDGDTVVLAWQTDGHRGRREMNRLWIEVVCACAAPCRNCRLSLRSQGVETEVGHYLSDEARLKLASALRKRLRQ